MEPILFLAHRLPFPPNKGDKVRSHHFLKHLAGRYRVFLGTFVDDPADWQHVEALRSHCADMHVEAIGSWSKRAGSAAGLLRGEALTLGYFRSQRLHDWVKNVAARQRITKAFVFSSPMAQYALDLPQVRSFIDMVDMDSAKWGEYALKRRWPVSALYRREATRLLAYEREIAVRSQASIFVTEEEAKLFRDAAPECAARVITIGNGVDGVYFSPSPGIASPFPAGECAIVFTGAMDYWPNIDAVSWFAHEIMPRIRAREASARFYVVGMNPKSTVRALASDPAVVVTGRVDDVRPFLQHARVVVAPLRVARGIQNKVLEAMAMAKPVVVTSAMAAGMSARPGVELESASEPSEFAERVLALMDVGRAGAMGASARSRILRDYTWTASYARLDALLECDSANTSAGVQASAGGIRCAVATG
jgi:sugar transferase (PEP-CTERM/EpsH1 system associated)